MNDPNKSEALLKNLLEGPLGNLYAKSDPPQTIFEHTKALLDLYEEFQVAVPEMFSSLGWKVLKLAIMAHDLGKADNAYQDFIKSKIEKDDSLASDTYIHHNYLSPTLLPKELSEELKSDWDDLIKEFYYKILIRSVYYHHARVQKESKYLENYISENFSKNSLEKILGPYKLNKNFVSRIEFSNETGAEELWLEYIKIKGMLNRIDYTASSGFSPLDIPVKDDFDNNVSDLTQQFMVKKNYSLRPVQKYMYEHKDENIIVVAATGSGKTEAALLWLENNKSFYTLPLKVSINAIFERIKKQILYKNVGLLHSDAQSIYYRSTDNFDLDDPIFQYNCAKLLSMPMTICTIDQIFKFVYKFNGCEAAAATLSYSKVIIDEIQMYSPTLVATILVALKTITDLGGKFAIITATFPPLLYKFMKQLKIPFKYDEKPVIFHSEYTHRHRIKILSENHFPIETIKELAKTKKVLIITNTIKSAQMTYLQLKNELEDEELCIGMLHSAFIKKHRDKLEEEILKFAPNNKNRNNAPGIWISTQIVEASLDLDFDVLFTEMCAIDSLLQRMGRVWRSRNYNLSEPNVYVLDNRNGVGKDKIIDPEIYDYSLKALKSFDNELLYENATQDYKQDMISMVYDEKINIEIQYSSYYEEIYKKIDFFLKLSVYSLEKIEADKNFRDIDSITVMPKSIYEELQRKNIINYWKAKLQSNIDRYEKQKTRDEINNYVLPLNHYHNYLNAIETNSDLIYKNSKIFLYKDNYEYIEREDGSIRGIGVERGSFKKSNDKDNNNFI